jgi:hypothetical protein
MKVWLELVRFLPNYAMPSDQADMRREMNEFAQREGVDLDWSTEDFRIDQLGYEPKYRMRVKRMGA